MPTYETLLVELLTPLLRDGFRRVLLLNGHGGNIVPAQQALFEVRGGGASGYDEFVDTAGNIRPAWQELAECVGERGRGGLDQLRAVVRGLVDNDGITYIQVDRHGTVVGSGPRFASGECPAGSSFTGLLTPAITHVNYVKVTDGTITRDLQVSAS